MAVDEVGAVNSGVPAETLTGCFMADLFQPGALVMLKSGGPLMTVTRYKEYTGYRSCECKWFNGPNVQVAEFRDVELRAHDEGPVLA